MVYDKSTKHNKHGDYSPRCVHLVTNPAECLALFVNSLYEGIYSFR